MVISSDISLGSSDRTEDSPRHRTLNSNKIDLINVIESKVLSWPHLTTSPEGEATAALPISPPSRVTLAPAVHPPSASEWSLQASRERTRCEDELSSSAGSIWKYGVVDKGKESCRKKRLVCFQLFLPPFYIRLYQQKLFCNP